jgi:hypothetical protein
MTDATDKQDVDIVMPTYNCAPWLDRTIESILEQDLKNWRLIARDDRSSDETHQRLCGWQEKLGGRMIVLPDSGVRNLGVTGNFNAVLGVSTAQWIMSADPDDVWLPGKMGRTFQAMREAESQFGAATPLAICTDAEVVDGAGQAIAPSYWRWSRIELSRIGDITGVAMESAALGSTMMVNRALLERALPIPPGAPYQDWWLALIATAFGRLIPLVDKTILYRRHGSNETADPYSSSMGGALQRAIAAPGSAQRRLRKVVTQSSSLAGAFVERYRSSLKEGEAAALDCLANLFSLGPWERRRALFRHRLWFGSRLKNLGLLALV